MVKNSGAIQLMRIYLSYFTKPGILRIIIGLRLLYSVTSCRVLALLLVAKPYSSGHLTL